MAVAVGTKGGQKLAAYLAAAVARLEQPATLKVGFLAKARYPDGTSVAAIAAQNEFGGTIIHNPGEITVYRKINAVGDFLRGGRFVKRSQSNFATTHTHAAYLITIPPRPFFRNMIKANKAGWGPMIAKLMKPNGYDPAKVLGLMGEKIVGQLRKSIRDFRIPANAPSTIRQKGFDKPLIGGRHDSGGGGVMLNSADYEVITQ